MERFRARCQKETSWQELLLPCAKKVLLCVKPERLCGDLEPIFVKKERLCGKLDRLCGKKERHDGKPERHNAKPELHCRPCRAFHVCTKAILLHITVETLPLKARQHRCFANRGSGSVHREFERVQRFFC